MDFRKQLINRDSSDFCCCWTLPINDAAIRGKKERKKEREREREREKERKLTERNEDRQTEMWIILPIMRPWECLQHGICNEKIDCETKRMKKIRK